VKGIGWAGVIIGAVLLCCGAAASAAEAERVDLTMTEYRFDPSLLSFQRGVAYRLHLENTGRELHEFTAPEFFRAIDIATRDVLNRDGNEIVMPPGARKDLDFTAPQPGHYPFACADHDWAGMTGEITVE
jgi:uncharacterized cupredoxin-like copper-binding protein